MEKEGSVLLKPAFIGVVVLGVIILGGKASLKGAYCVLCF